MTANVIRKILAAAAGAVLVAGSLVACDSGSQQDVTYQPSAYGPQISGQASCAYVVDPQECADSGVPSQYWYQMPGDQPAGYVDSQAAFAAHMVFWLWWWRLAYDPWYSSYSYYGYYVPSRYRSTYVRTHVTYVENHYHTSITSYSKRTTYRSSTGKTVSGSRVPTKRFGTSRTTTRSRTGSCNTLSLYPVGGTLVKFGGGSSRSGSVSGGSRYGGSSRSGSGSTRSRSGSGSSRSGSSKSSTRKGC